MDAIIQNAAADVSGGIAADASVLVTGIIAALLIVAGLQLLMYVLDLDTWDDKEESDKKGRS